jgi:hypothetical protein
MIADLGDILKERASFNDAVGTLCRQHPCRNTRVKSERKDSRAYVASLQHRECKAPPQRTRPGPPFFLDTCLRCGNHGPCQRHHIWYSGDAELVILCLKCHSYITSLNTKCYCILMKTLRVKVPETKRPVFRNALFQFFIKHKDFNLSSKGRRHTYLREFCYQNQEFLRSLPLPLPSHIPQVVTVWRSGKPS